MSQHNVESPQVSDTQRGWKSTSPTISAPRVFKDTACSFHTGAVWVEFCLLCWVRHRHVLAVLNEGVNLPPAEFTGCSLDRDILAETTKSACHNAALFSLSSVQPNRWCLILQPLDQLFLMWTVSHHLLSFLLIHMNFSMPCSPGGLSFSLLET